MPFSTYSIFQKKVCITIFFLKLNYRVTHFFDNILLIKIYRIPLFINLFFQDFYFFINWFIYLYKCVCEYIEFIQWEVKQSKPSAIEHPFLWVFSFQIKQELRRAMSAQWPNCPAIWNRHKDRQTVTELYVVASHA